MPKRIRNIVILTVLVLLGFFASKSYFSPTSPSKDDELPQISNSKKETSKPKSQTSRIEKKKIEKSTIQTVSAFLMDTSKSPQDRVYKVRDLDLNSETPKGQDNINSLIVFINSDNPYLNDPDAHRPHSFKSYQLQKEASLRVYSLKRISHALPVEKLRVQLQKVINGSSDQAIIKIAKQVLEAKEKGDDYFENLKQGIRSMKGPSASPSHEDDHDHH